jgi:subtilisin family serine protease
VIIRLWLALLLLLGAAMPPTRVTAVRPVAHLNTDFIPGRILVKLRVEQNSLTNLQTALAFKLEGILARPEIASARPLFPGPFSDPRSAREIGLERIYLLELANEIDVFTAITTLSTDPAVEVAEPDYILRTAVLPNDAGFSQQWGFENTGQQILGETGVIDADIDLPEAWEIAKGSPDIVIAIVDTGVDLTHPDLVSKLVPGYNIIDDNDLPLDDDGHGTHVAGIAAAATDNDNIGVAGVCWECKIMPIKALGTEGGSTSDVATAIRYAVDHGAHVINLSLGGSSGTEALLSAVRYAYSREIPVVAAMGNFGSAEPFYPAAYPETIAVGASDKFDLRWEYSNYGEDIDLVAPGVQILSAYFLDRYAYMNGTSMAAPHVSGVIGLLRSMFPNKTVEVLRTILTASADDLGDPGWDIYYGAGRLNAFLALRSLANGLGLSPASREGYGLQETLVEYTFTIINTGDSTDTFNLELSPSPAGWAAALPVSSITLEEGNAAQIMVQVTVSADVQLGDIDTIMLTASSATTPSITANAAIITKCAEAAEGYEVSLLPASQESSSLVGTVFEYSLTITNTGNYFDIYNLTLSGLIDPWDAELSENKFTLASGEAANVNVFVTIPASALEYERLVLTVSAISQTYNSISSTATLTTVSIYNKTYLPVILR